MEKNQENICDCGTDRTDGCDQMTGTGGYPCDKFKDPGWLKTNIDYFPAGFAAPSGIFSHITPDEALNMLRQDEKDYLILDVKTEEEFRQTHLPDSLNLDFFSPGFKDELFAMDKSAAYIVICKIGMRSEITMNLMEKMGFMEVYNVLGGDDRWAAEELPSPAASCAVPCST